MLSRVWIAATAVTTAAAETGGTNWDEWVAIGTLTLAFMTLVPVGMSAWVARSTKSLADSTKLLADSTASLADHAEAQLQSSYRPVLVPYLGAEQVCFAGGTLPGGRPDVHERPDDRPDLPDVGELLIAVRNVGAGPALDVSARPRDRIPVAEYLLMSESIYEQSDSATREHSAGIELELERLGVTTAYFVDLDGIAPGLPPLAEADLTSRLTETIRLMVGGLPAMVGIRRRRSATRTQAS